MSLHHFRLHLLVCPQLTAAMLLEAAVEVTEVH